jgi:hypothetical protein
MSWCDMTMINLSIVHYFLEVCVSEWKIVLSVYFVNSVFYKV